MALRVKFFTRYTGTVWGLDNSTELEIGLQLDHDPARTCVLVLDSKDAARVATVIDEWLTRRGTPRGKD
jgi:hypothetical protein